MSTPAQIVPLGDSITQAESDYNSYRRPLWQRLQAGGYNVNFVGSMSRVFCDAMPPDNDFDPDHEGHWGWRVDEVLDGRGDDGCSGAGRLADWLANYTPDVALVHLGTNDLWQAQSISSTIADLETLIDTLRDDNPDVVVLIAQLIPATAPTLNARINTLNAQIPGVAARKSLPNSPVVVVNQNAGFDAVQDTYDGVHPNLTGENKMAQRWFDALLTVLSLPRLPATIRTGVLTSAPALRLDRE